MNREILKFEDVTYTYDDDYNALESISLSINSHEKIAVLGTNGSGKSTFFLCCNGILQPTSGNVQFKGRAMKYSRSQLTELRKTVGIVFQDANQQFIGTTAFDDVSFGPINLGLSRDDVIQSTKSALDAMNLNDYENRPPHYLSGGEKKRLSIAGILAMNPQVILFDEPTAFLDDYNILIFEDIVNSLYDDDKTILISTHDIDFAFKWAERVIVFHDGKLIADGDCRSLLTDEEILKKANLPLPTMLQIDMVLKSNGLLPKNSSTASSISELNEILKALENNE